MDRAKVVGRCDKFAFCIFRWESLNILAMLSGFAFLWCAFCIRFVNNLYGWNFIHDIGLMTKLTVIVVTYAVSKQASIICQLFEKIMFSEHFQNCNFFMIKTNTEIYFLIKNETNFVFCVAITYISNSCNSPFRSIAIISQIAFKTIVGLNRWIQILVVT